MRELFISMVSSLAGSQRPFLALRAVLLVALGLMACQLTEPSAPLKAPPVDEAANSSLFLKIQSVTGESVPQALLRLNSGQRSQANAPGTLFQSNTPAPAPRFQSDEQGNLLLEHLSSGRQTLQVQAPGFIPTSMTLALGKGVKAGSRLQLMPLGEPVATFDTSQGAEFERDGIQVTVNPGGPLLDDQGLPIEGQVEAFLVPVDLENGGLQGAPGLQQGLIQPEGPPVNLESLAMMALVFRKKDPGGSVQQPNPGDVSIFARRTSMSGGVPRSIRAGSLKNPQLSCRVDALAGDRRPVPLWRLDPLTGYWVPLGETAFFSNDRWEVSLDNPPPLINVALPFWWRSAQASQDNPLQVPQPPWVETGCIAVRLMQENGQPAAGRMVVAQGLDYVSLNRALTNDEGLALLEVMRGRKVRVEAGQMSVSLVVHQAGPCQGKAARPTSVTLRVATQVCTPGASSDCPYSGPSQTLGQGACQTGKRFCDTEGSGWSDSCVGEVLPQPERCENALDDNCDRTIDENCPRCQQGESRPCYRGPNNTQSVGLCRAGAQQCLPGGIWSACEGEVLPEAEDCFRPLDENCDRVVCQCWPGLSERCYTGPTGTRGKGICQDGTQTCNATGTGWSACTGDVTPLPQEDCATPVDDDCDGEVNEGCYACPPNTSQDCYTGPASTRNKGICQDGTQTCNATGTGWSECTGDITPLPQEDCETLEDDNCNGKVNEGCGNCTPNSSQACYTGPGNTAGVGRCVAGRQTCNAAGTGWSVCRGEVTPLPQEDCTTPEDDNCNGRVNEECAPCTPNSSQPCYTGPGNTAGVGRCVAGTQTCNAAGTGWSACRGEVTPLPQEDCTTPADDNCDGNINENPPCDLGSMHSPRSKHAAVRLGNGMVLVSGGQNTDPLSLQTAERYNPLTRTWSLTRPMTEARAHHTATLLHNGKVLVTGGNSTSAYLQTAELYDPETDTWSAARSMTSPRQSHTATLLSTGKVLVSGGWFGSGYTPKAEVYSPDQDDWSPAQPMTFARTDHAATLLDDGRVLVTGGYNGNRTLNTAELYDPLTNKWVWLNDSPMTSYRQHHTATLLRNGKVLVTGGHNGAGPLRTTELYDPLTNKWSRADDMSSPRSGHRATELLDGKVLITGGTGNSLAVELYDPDSNRLSSAGTLRAPRSEHTATLMNNGQVLISGGSGTPAPTTEVYSP